MGTDDGGTPMSVPRHQGRRISVGVIGCGEATQIIHPPTLAAKAPAA